MKFLSAPMAWCTILSIRAIWNFPTHSSQQPPIQVKPVEVLQVVFGSTGAMIKWSEPLEGNSEGCGSWNNWTCVVKIGNSKEQRIFVSHDNLNKAYGLRIQVFMLSEFILIQVQGLVPGVSHSAEER